MLCGPLTWSMLFEVTGLDVVDGAERLFLENLDVGQLDQACPPLNDVYNLQWTRLSMI